MDSIGKQIKERRKSLKVTQRQLAELSGVGINTLTKIERDEANPSLRIIEKILDTLSDKFNLQSIHDSLKPIWDDMRPDNFFVNAKPSNSFNINIIPYSIILKKNILG